MFNVVFTYYIYNKFKFYKSYKLYFEYINIIYFGETLLNIKTNSNCFFYLNFN